MGKKLALGFVLLCCTFVSFAQVKIADENLKKQANIINNAIYKSDFSTVVKYTHPKIVAMMGGERNVVAMMQKSINPLDRADLKYTKVSIGKIVQKIQSASNIQCIVPLIKEVRKGNTVKTITDYAFCISYNKGKDWYFVGSPGAIDQQLRLLIPEIAKDIVFPKPKVSTKSL